MKIAFYALRPFDELPLVEKYSAEYGIDFVWTTEYPNPGNLKLAEGCIAISCTPCEMRTEWVDTYHGLGVKYFLCRAIGFDHLPLEHLAKYGMKASNSPYPTDCVANYAIMLMMMAARKVNETMIRAAAQDFSLKGKMGRDISNLTVGVIGTGHIGSTVIRHLSGFGCRILTHSRRVNPGLEKLAEYVDMDTLYAESDIITLHTALNDATFHMINSESIAKMKDGVILVNTGRGPLVDTKALIAGLKSGKISEAAIDVFEDEAPLIYKNRMGEVIQDDDFNLLQSMPNVTVTPHVAFYTETTVQNMISKQFIAVDCYAKGLPNPYQVN